MQLLMRDDKRRHWIASLAAIGAAAAVGGAIAALACQPPANADVAWYFVLARAIDAGSNLYSSVREPNTPLIVWVSQAAIAVSNVVGASPHRSYFVAVALALSTVIANIHCLIKQSSLLSIKQNLIFVVGVAWIFAVLPGPHIGQRDQLVAIGLLPYVVSAVARDHQRRWLNRLAPIGLAIALLIKPHFITVPLAIEIWRRTRCARRQGWVRERFWKSQAVVAGVIALLGATVMLLLEPDYLDFLSSFGDLYLAWPATPFGGVAWTLVLMSPALALITLVQTRPLPSALSIAAAGCLTATALQQKWWDYHFVPVMLFLAAALLAILLPPPNLKKVRNMALVAVACVCLAWGALSSWRTLRIYTFEWEPTPEVASLQEWIDSVEGSPAKVAVLGTFFFDYMPAVYSSGAQWVLADPALWYLYAFPALQPLQPKRLNALIAESIQAIASDPPDILGLQNVPPNGEPDSLISGRKDFQSLLSSYEPLGQTRMTRFWRLKPSSTQP